MGVKYITVTPITNLFVPATRSFGDIAIIGAIDATAQGLKKSPLPITNPLAVSSQPVTLTTSGATAAGNSTLQFAAVPPTIQPGMIIADLNSPTNQPSVTSSHSRPITLVTNATTAAFDNEQYGRDEPERIRCRRWRQRRHPILWRHNGPVQDLHDRRYEPKRDRNWRQ